MPQKYNAIIFDLGGVLYDIDTQRTKAAFAEIGIADFNQFYNLEQQIHLFDALEKGQIDETAFVEGINKISGKSFDAEQVKQAWNALLIGMPGENIDLLKELKTQGYALYLLSNTNIYHYSAIQEELKTNFGLNALDDLFDKAYCSFQIGMRKPDVEIYQHVVKTSILNPETTVFIDDNEDNIKSSISAGLPAIHKQKHISLRELLERFVF